MAGLEGQSISEFEILSQIGQGGMGTVYLARQSSLNRSVALKVLSAHLANDAVFIQRFRREATVAASLGHPDIVQVLAAGEHSGVHFIAMEYVDGEPLRTRLAREGRIAPAEALAIAAHMAQALNYAWQKVRLIHRDIKPSNILISKEGHVKLADLGMVKCLDDETSQLTSTGVALGTPYYTSPEQARSRPDIDFRADIYSLGCTLYHMLTGQLPYEGSGDSLAVLFKQVNDPPPDILEVMPECPPAIATLLNKMLAKDRDRRHQSYDELIAEIYAAHDQTPQQSFVASKAGSQKSAYAVAAIAIVIIVAGLLVWSPWKNRINGPSSPISSAHTEQRPKDTAPALTHSTGTKIDTSPSASATTKPVGDAPSSTKPQSPALANGKNSSSPSAEASQQLLAAVVPSSNHVAVAMPSEQSPPTAATPTAAPVRNVDTNAQPATPIPAPNTPSPVMDGDAAFIKSVVALQPEQQVASVMAKLKERNPQFDGKETHKIENGAVTELAFSTVGVTDITPLKALKWLKKLSIAPPGTNQKGALSDLSPLVGLPLTGLWCQGNAITDLSPLKDMPLTVLSCGSTQIKDIAPLTGLKLTVLSFNDAPVADLAPLDGMPLMVLWCNNTKVTDLSPLKAAPLQELRCDFVAERDAALLRNVKTLIKINDVPAAVFWMRVSPIVSTLPSPSGAHTSVIPANIKPTTGSGKDNDNALGNDAAWKRAVNLLSLIDPVKDAVKGEWRIKDNELVSDKSRQAQIQLPFEPPNEYDFRIVFTCSEGMPTVCHYLSHRGSCALWIMGGVSTFIFPGADATRIKENRNTAHADRHLEFNRKYVSLLQVRNKGVTAYFDGDLVCRWTTDYSDARLFSTWDTPNHKCLALGCDATVTIFHTIELLELSGKGKPKPPHNRNTSTIVPSSPTTGSAKSPGATTQKSPPVMNACSGRETHHL
jgi:serine/threonine protein kinase